MLGRSHTQGAFWANLIAFDKFLVPALPLHQVVVIQEIRGRTTACLACADGSSSGVSGTAAALEALASASPLGHSQVAHRFVTIIGRGPPQYAHK